MTTLPIGRIRAVLMVAPHPDDEAIGAFALLRRLRRRGVPVTVAIVSDGAASHPGSARWPKPRLVRERARESRRALRRIEVAAGDVRLLGLPDGRLGDHAPLIRRRVAALAAALPRPLLALAPSPIDAHPDHRAVAAAAQPQAGVRWLRYPVWPTGQRLPGARALRLSAQERLAKRQAIRSYRTQAGRITDDPDGFAMTARQIATFSRAQEWFAGAWR